MANQCTGKAASEIPALKPYRGKLAVRNFRGDDGNVGIIRSPVRAIVLPDRAASNRPMRALASEVRLSNRLQAKTAAERDDFAPYVSKSVPQRLKPSWEGLLWHG